MTIKHTRKDIASETGDVMLNVKKNTPTLANANSNYSSNLILTLTKQNQYNEELYEDIAEPEDGKFGGNDLEPYDDITTIEIPIKEFTRLKYIQANYYDKTGSDERYYTKAQIDAKVKPHYEIVTTVPTVSQVKTAGKENYIFLKADPNHVGDFIEYMYVVDDNGQNEKIEQIGTTAIDLSDYVLTSTYNTDKTNLQNQITQISTKFETSIPENADLNNYVTSGFYYCTSEEKSITIKHYPEYDGTTLVNTNADSFTLLVEKINNNSVKQTLTEYCTPSENRPSLYIRIKQKTTSDWTNWKRVVFDTDELTPASHTHGNITNDGKIGSTSGLPLITTTDGTITVGVFGNGAGQFAEGTHTHTYINNITLPSNLNNFKTKGFAVSTEGQTAPTNLPFTLSSNQTFTVANIPSDADGDINQLVILNDFKNSKKSRIWIRGGSNSTSTWSPWIEIVTDPNQYYTKTEIDTLIGTLAQLQQQTLGIL